MNVEFMISSSYPSRSIAEQLGVPDWIVYDLMDEAMRRHTGQDVRIRATTRAMAAIANYTTGPDWHPTERTLTAQDAIDQALYLCHMMAALRDFPTRDKVVVEWTSEPET